jgi:glycosyltransferase involved in cell wall biosynthesis
LKALEGSRHCAVLLMGRGSDDMASEVLRSMPGWRGRLYGAGELPSDDLSRHIGACDVLVQPYPDGVSSRRSTLMAALAHGRAVVTTEGPLTESLWQESAAVVLTRTGDAGALAAEVARLAADPARTRVLGAAARSLYDARFALGGIVDTLMRADRGEGRLRAVS